MRRSQWAREARRPASRRRTSARAFAAVSGVLCLQSRRQEGRNTAAVMTASSGRTAGVGSRPVPGAAPPRGRTTTAPGGGRQGAGAQGSGGRIVAAGQRRPASGRRRGGRRVGIGTQVAGVTQRQAAPLARGQAQLLPLGLGVLGLSPLSPLAPDGRRSGGPLRRLWLAGGSGGRRRGGSSGRALPLPSSRIGRPEAELPELLPQQRSGRCLARGCLHLGALLLLSTLHATLMGPTWYSFYGG